MELRSRRDMERLNEIDMAEIKPIVQPKVLVLFWGDFHNKNKDKAVVPEVSKMSATTMI